MEELNILVIGTGMYSTGRGTDTFGTVLPAIFEWKRSGAAIGRVIFTGTDGINTPVVEEKCRTLAEKTGVNLSVEVFPKGKIKNSYEYQNLLAEIPRPACVIVAVPDHLHFNVVRDCLLSDLPVLVVKPFTPLVSQGEDLIRLAEERKLYGAIEFHKRWDKANILIRDVVRRSELGELLYCWVEYSQRKSIPTEMFRDWSARSSILQYLGVHYIDIIMFYTDAKPLRVMATGQKNWLVKQGIDTWDAIQCTVEWSSPSGSTFVQTLLTNWIDPETTSAVSDQKIKIVGTKGRVESDQKNRGLAIVTDDNCPQNPNPDFCLAYGCEDGLQQWRGYGIDSVVMFLNDVESLNRGAIDLEYLSKNRPVFQQGLVSTAVIEAAHTSLHDNSSWKDICLPR